LAPDDLLFIHWVRSEVSYENLMEIFYDKHDPTTPNQQGNDRGTQYRSAGAHTDVTVLVTQFNVPVFYYNDQQKAVALAVKSRREKEHDIR
jgi:peptide methionine sulfoxide reductase MsrA